MNQDKKSTFTSDWKSFQKYDAAAQKALGGKAPDAAYLQSKADILRALIQKHKPANMEEMMKMREAYMELNKTQKALNTVRVKQVTEGAKKVGKAVGEGLNATGQVAAQGIGAAGKATGNLLRRLNRNPFIRLLTETVRLLFNLVKLVVRAAVAVLSGGNRAVKLVDNAVKGTRRPDGNKNGEQEKQGQQQQRDDKPSLAVAKDGTMQAVQKNRKNAPAKKATVAVKHAAQKRTREVSTKGPSNQVKVR